MPPTPVIVDCDPGHDDMVAILLAAAHPAIDLLAITTVAGNGSLEATTRNARAVCELGGITEVPIAAGAPQPLVGTHAAAVDIHGESALDGADLPSGDAVPLAAEHAVDLMARLIATHPEPVTLCPLGPVTNVALLLSLHPELVPRIREISLMGGTMGEGNRHPVAEFNVWADPEALQVVLDSGVPTTLCGLDVTHQALATPAVLERLAAQGTELARTVGELLVFFRDAYRTTFDLPDPPLHDPVAIARVIDPAIVTTISANVVVETSGTYTRGATVVDRHGVTDRPVNAQVAVGLDVEAFWALVLDAIAHLGATT